MNETIKKQKLTVEDRARMTADGIIGVRSFDEEYLELETTLGILAIGGEGMMIEELDRKGGSVTVTGKINEWGYKEKKGIKRRGKL